MSHVKIAFYQPGPHDYDPRTPLTRPTGGTESAVSYLSAALSRAGVQVVLVNGAQSERVVDGVHIIPGRLATKEVFASCDLVVVVSAAIGARVRPFLREHTPLVLWEHHDIDQRAVAPLSNPQERDAWTAFVMVSRWQTERMHRQFGVPIEKVNVIGNGVSPAFLEKPLGPAWFERGLAPCLVYTSTPFRGLDILLQSFPSLRARIPDLRLRIHSSMNIYGIGADQDPYHYLYELARIMPGVDYVGPVSQSQLSESMQSVAAFAYPNTFLETSCIAVMEAMASGAEVFTTNGGALPETLNGFGQMVERPRVSSDPAFVNNFIALVTNALIAARNDPQTAAQRRRERAAFARANYHWDVRARSWIDLANRLISAS